MLSLALKYRRNLLLPVQSFTKSLDRGICMKPGFNSPYIADEQAAGARAAAAAAAAATGAARAAAAASHAAAGQEHADDDGSRR